MSKKKPGTSGVIEAAGGLLWRDSESGKQIAIVHRIRYDDWSFPKGWRENGETFLDAAIREVTEETNCKFELRAFAGATSYLVHGVPKIVLFWNMQLKGECGFKPNSEVDRLEWVEVSQALLKLDYEDERLLLGRVMKAWS
jgi:8-oxo-dGTP pyrophosphatase MutT (NUDIX family)